MSWWDQFQQADPLEAALRAEGVSGQLADLARSVYVQESGAGKNTRTSNAGAVGGMQIIPSTFREVADRGWDIQNPLDNARAGVRYLSQLLERSGGDPMLAAAGYYGGPGAMDKAREGVAVSDPRNPKAPTTLEYARQVVARMGGTSTEQTTGWWSDFPIATPDAKQSPVAHDPGVSAPDEAKAEKVPPSLGSEVLRQMGLTARAAVSGVAALPAMLSDAVTGPINAGLDALQGEGKGFRFKRAGVALNDAMTAVGLPEPKNATERVVQDVAGSMAGAGGVVGLGNTLAKGSGAVQGIGKVLADAPGLQSVSAATGAAGSGIARESGASPTEQVLAGVAGALGPTVVTAGTTAALKAAMGADGQTAARVQAFRQAGTEPTVAQATGGRFAQATESLLAKTPGSAGRMAEFAQQQTEDLAASVQNLADELAPHASAVNAGEAIARGVNAFKAGVKAVQQRLYSALDDHIPSSTPIRADRTAAVLDDLTQHIDGAESLSGLLTNRHLEDVQRALQADLQDGTLPYRAVKQLRSVIGEKIADAGLIPDISTRQLRALYGALSDDLGAAAKQAGPEAEHAWSWANQFTRDQMRRLDDLSTIVNRDAPEKVFQAVVSGSGEGDTVARRVISALPMKERREVAGAVLQRLGRANPGQQNAMGDAFSAEMFLTNLSKLSPAARETLLGRTDLDGLMERINEFATVAATRREGGRVFANPSGTAPALAQAGLGTGLAGGAVAAAMGQPAPLLGALAVPAAANAVARAMTSPEVVNRLTAPASLAGLPGVTVNTAAQLDPEPLPWWSHFEQVPVLSGHDVASAVRHIDSEPLPPIHLPEPTDTRGQFEKIAEAKSVGEAIAAFETPNVIQVNRRAVDDRRIKLDGEIQRLKQMSEQAHRLRTELERKRLEAMRAAY